MEKALLSSCCGDGSSTLVSLWMQKALPQNSHVRNVQNRKHVVKKKIITSRLTLQSPWPLPEVPCGLTKEQRLEAEGSDEVIPACDQLDFPLIPHLKEKYTEGSWCARPHCSRKVPCQGATVGK